MVQLAFIDEIGNAVPFLDDEGQPIQIFPDEETGVLTPPRLSASFLSQALGEERQLPSTEQIMQILRDIAQQTAPQRQAFAIEGMNRLVSRAQGSPQGLINQFRPQIDNIRQTLNTAFQNISRRLGPSGGGQIEREEEAALGGAGRQLQQLLGGGQIQGQADLLGFLRRIRPALLSTLPQPTEVTSPADLTGLGRILGGVAESVSNIFSRPTTPAPFQTQPILLPPGNLPAGGAANFT